MVRRTWWLCAMMVIGGCAPGNPGLIIGGVLAPDDSCGYDPSGAGVHTGRLDVAPGRVEYTVTALVFNNLLNLGNAGTGVPMADPNIINIRQAEIELRDVQDNPLALDGLPNPFTVPASGVIASGDGSEAGAGIATFDAIPSIYGAALRGAAGSRIVAVLRVIGVTAGGSEIRSGELFWPIDLCEGCLFACIVTEEDEMLCQPSCTPGQDSLTVSPAVCGGVLASCIPGT